MKHALFIAALLLCTAPAFARGGGGHSSHSSSSGSTAFHSAAIFNYAPMHHYGHYRKPRKEHTRLLPKRSLVRDRLWVRPHAKHSIWSVH